MDFCRVLFGRYCILERPEASRLDLQQEHEIVVYTCANRVRRMSEAYVDVITTSVLQPSPPFSDQPLSKGGQGWCMCVGGIFTQAYGVITCLKILLVAEREPVIFGRSVQAQSCLYTGIYSPPASHGLHP